MPIGLVSDDLLGLIIRRSVESKVKGQISGQKTNSEYVQLRDAMRHGTVQAVLLIQLEDCTVKFTAIASMDSVRGVFCEMCPTST